MAQTLRGHILPETASQRLFLLSIVFFYIPTNYFLVSEGYFQLHALFSPVISVGTLSNDFWNKQSPILMTFSTFSTRLGRQDLSCSNLRWLPLIRRCSLMSHFLRVDFSHLPSVDNLTVLLLCFSFWSLNTEIMLQTFYPKYLISSVQCLNESWCIHLVLATLLIVYLAVKPLCFLSLLNIFLFPRTTIIYFITTFVNSAGWRRRSDFESSIIYLPALILIKQLALSPDTIIHLLLGFRKLCSQFGLDEQRKMGPLFKYNYYAILLSHSFEYPNIISSAGWRNISLGSPTITL